MPGFRAARARASPKTWHIWSRRSLGVGRRRKEEGAGKKLKNQGQILSDKFFS